MVGLAAAGAFDLLRGLFGAATVTAAVHDEVLAAGALPSARELEAADTGASTPGSVPAAAVAGTAGRRADRP